MNMHPPTTPSSFPSLLAGLLLLILAGSAWAAEEPAVESMPAESVETPASTAIDQAADPATEAEPAPPAAAVTAPGEDETAQNLDQKVRDLKRDIIELNRDLFILEEELLFPSSTQLAVFLSMDVGYFFKLDAVQLKIDDQEVANYLYTRREVDALARGGVQRLYIGNVKTGARELIATFIGYGPNGREYKRAASHTFEKGTETKYIELQITDDTRKEQPEFSVREWE